MQKMHHISVIELITRINIVVELFPIIQPHFNQSSIIFVYYLRSSTGKRVWR